MNERDAGARAGGRASSARGRALGSTPVIPAAPRVSPLNRWYLALPFALPFAAHERAHLPFPTLPPSSFCPSLPPPCSARNARCAPYAHTWQTPLPRRAMANAAGAARNTARAAACVAHHLCLRALPAAQHGAAPLFSHHISTYHPALSLAARVSPRLF